MLPMQCSALHSCCCKTVAISAAQHSTGGSSLCLQIATEKKEQELRELQRKHGVDGEQHPAPKKAKAEA